MSYPATLGVVLAGGQSRRMGGQDKALLSFGDKPLIAHMTERLAPQCARIIVNANGDATRFSTLGLPVVADSFADYRGPLAGILAALDWMARNEPSLQWLASIAVDTPFFPDDFVTRLHEERVRSGAPLVMAQSAGRQHPVDALWPVTLRDDLRTTLIANNNRKVGAWMRVHNARTAIWHAEPTDPFMNINTPEEFVMADELHR